MTSYGRRSLRVIEILTQIGLELGGQAGVRIAKWSRLLVSCSTVLRLIHNVISPHNYNTARPHQGIEQQIPISPSAGDESGPVRCRDVIDGIIHDYYHDTA